MLFLKRIYYTILMKYTLRGEGYSISDCWELVGEMLKVEKFDDE